MPQPHDNWATYYDYVYERTYEGIYDQFTNETLEVIKEILPRGKVIDYGAGTGRISIPLAERGYLITAVERSLPMAEIIQQKANEAKVNISISSSSINDYRNGQFDLALCLFTVLNYILKEDEMKIAFKNIGDHLKPKGYFFFDIPTNQKLFEGHTINKADFSRRIDLKTTGNNLYNYSEECNGKMNGRNFNYSDSFSIRRWNPNEIDHLLQEAAFKEVIRDFSPLDFTGSKYKLYQKIT